MMWSPEAVAMVIDALNKIGSPYFVTGSVASNAYCEPRGTIDADFVLEAGGNEIAQLRDRLKDHFAAEEQMAFETVTGTVQHKFRHRETKFLIEVFEADVNDPHERSRFSRRRAALFAGTPTFYPTAEDVIVQKLRWYKQIRRRKDRDDCVNVMRSQFSVLDWSYLEHWCGEHTTLDFLKQIRVEVQRVLNGSTNHD